MSLWADCPHNGQSTFGSALKLLPPVSAPRLRLPAPSTLGQKRRGKLSPGDARATQSIFCGAARLGGVLAAEGERRAQLLAEAAGQIRHHAQLFDHQWGHFAAVQSQLRVQQEARNGGFERVFSASLRS